MPKHTHVLLYFSAKWCAPCRVVSKSIEKIDAQFPNILVSKVDVDDQAEFASGYSIKSLPTCLLIDEKGTEVSRVVGARTKEDLINELRLPE